MKSEKLLSSPSSFLIPFALRFLFSWLHWVFRCHALTFSSCGERGLLCSNSVRASHCSGFSCWRAQALGTQASAVAAHGFSGGGSWALDCGISSRDARAYPLHQQGSPYKTFLRPGASEQLGVFADIF